MDNKVVTPGGVKDSLIVCRNSQGAQLRATPLRLTRHIVVFEVYNPYSIVQLSEVLNEFQIFIGDKMMFSGRAVVSNLLNTGIMLVCEASLDEAWLDVDIFAPIGQKDRLVHEFKEFIQEWEKIYQVMPAYKVVVSDVQTFLVDLRRWMEQVELGVRSQPSGNRLELEVDLIQKLEPTVFETLGPLFDRFEQTSSLVSDELRPAHITYAKRQLHPLVSCAPFFFRSWQKPLGYAGDYEMVNMMVRTPYEGGTMFAKMVNSFFLNTPPVVAHRNRITQMSDLLEGEAKRCAEQGTSLKVFNLGCGPAQEIQHFMKHCDISDDVEFLLLDFNEQTLEYTGRQLDEIKSARNRKTNIRTTLKSVHQILKEAGKPGGDLQRDSYQMVYCAGLFDYLSERVCKRLMNVFYDVLAPGGLLFATNVDASKPFRLCMEHLMEWHLVCRDMDMMKSLVPDKAPPENVRIKGESTGVNLFIEVRKPVNAE